MTQKRIVDAKQRRAEIMVATLFLVTAAASIAGGLILESILTAPNYLAGISPNTAAVAWSALLWSINNIGIVFIAVFMYPLLRKLDENAAVGYLAVRIIEGTLVMGGVVATMMLIPLSAEYINAGAPPSSWYLTLGDMLVRVTGVTTVSLVLLGLSGIILTWMLFQHKMVPRVISVVGLVGYTLTLFGGLAAWFGLIDPASAGATIINLPLAAFEIILLPFWLFFRGFKMPEATETEVSE
jgi:Domain of unknown function (DUF4386)